ncbi:Male sterility protein [Aspergillus sclerotialis]|uniref:Male sterility protein n=1 Tax=Aspergillus sclerotialis TaxID=2070753 RepID=A0A3A2Z5Q0_9EURO|nr:Male sterility protein [Aspergillus sclerotialis]
MQSTPLFTVDQAMRQLVNTIPQKVLLSYPSVELEYADYTVADVDRLTRAAISSLPSSLRTLEEHGYNESSEKRHLVGVTGVSNLEYCITFLALLRLGVTPLVLSPRIPDHGLAYLLQKSKCQFVIASGHSLTALERVKTEFNMPELEVTAMLAIGILNNHSRDELFAFPNVQATSPDQAPQMIMHTGGTTGLPKLVPVSTGDWVFLTQRMVTHMAVPDTLSTLPLYHSQGLWLLFRCLLSGSKVAFLNAERPITAGTIMNALDRLCVTAIDTDPYTLKILTESSGAVEQLVKLEAVGIGGSAVPDDLGNSLISQGVKLRQLFGQTESGGLLQMSPDPDDGWNWLVPLPHVEEYLKFEQVDNDLYHLIVLPGLRAKRLTNREDGSYGTNDLFRKHPSSPNKWKFAARYDDIIVMLNGEKADPTPLEHALSCNQHVRVALCFGAGRASLGILVFLSDAAAGLSQEELEAGIAPSLDLGNARVPKYARVSLDSLIFKGPDTEVPITAKQTPIRARVLQNFASEIEEFYYQRERAQNLCSTSVPDSQVSEVVRHVVCEVLGIPSGEEQTIADNDDFFSLGMDSITASDVRVRLLRRINLGGQTLKTNVVFDNPSIELLSQHILRVRRRDSNGDPTPTEKLAMDLVRKYTNELVPLKHGAVPRSTSNVVLLTGATGTIGRHVLHTLVTQVEVGQVYCLVRADSNEAAMQRIRNSLETAHLLQTLEPRQVQRITPLSSNLNADNLGLSNDTYEVLCNRVTNIIHNAWAVNFNMHLASFEKVSIASVPNLLNLARRSHLQTKPRFTFISSIATISQAPQVPVAEVRYGWEAVGKMGYAQSKWVAEEICTYAAEHSGSSGPSIQILRIGQITGDTQHGMWNAREAIPSVVQTALTIGALPVIEGKDETHLWLPVDICAAAVVQLALSQHNTSGVSFFHVCNRRGFYWNAEFLPALRKAGLQFEELPQREWLRRLEMSDLYVFRNPPYRLLEHFTERYGRPREEEEHITSGDHYTIDTLSARTFAPVLDKADPVDDALVGKFVRYWLSEGWNKLGRIEATSEKRNA